MKSLSEFLQRVHKAPDSHSTPSSKIPVMKNERIYYNIENGKTRTKSEREGAQFDVHSTHILSECRVPLETELMGRLNPQVALAQEI